MTPPKHENVPRAEGIGEHAGWHLHDGGECRNRSAASTPSDAAEVWKDDARSRAMPAGAKPLEADRT